MTSELLDRIYTILFNNPPLTEEKIKSLLIEYPENINKILWFHCPGIRTYRKTYEDSKNMRPEMYFTPNKVSNSEMYEKLLSHYRK